MSTSLAAPFQSPPFVEVLNYTNSWMNRNDICVVAHKNEREDFRQLALFLFV